MNNSELEDLLNRCPNCGGRGVLISYPNLPQTCQMCRGSGKNPYGRIRVGPGALDYVSALLGGAVLGVLVGGLWDLGFLEISAGPSSLDG
jgi:hypothetical protein